ncbi:glycosyltransferase [Gillisia sp. M10.2A]|uniref:Glycosyltransferase n=1 Tax=Gillisia lutea TaxID=2909668 RepID=A0ABS9EKT8_9FLAO|nr:glycosyltransferase family 2 protein [Gillisia lutea]MCF4102123.1 glycosyltransferase [Gillisia lutea]
MGESFSILITTFNRIQDLKFTLNSLQFFLNEGVKIIICDDASTDGTSEVIKKEYPSIKLLVNSVNKGLIYSRNLLMNQVQTLYAITLDDDANFLSLYPLENIIEHFQKEPECGVIAFRIFWGLEIPKNLNSDDESEIVKSYVGCGHVWRMEAWHGIPNYPEWFMFYGEEEFASYQLFKKSWQVHYVPKILVHHRVKVSDRKSQNDYGLRLRRSLRSGWYNYVLFLPLPQIPKRFFYTLYIQLKLKAFRGDFKAAIAIFQALLDLIYHLPKLILNRNRLTKVEYKEFENLSNTKIYWKP